MTWEEIQSVQHNKNRLLIQSVLGFTDADYMWLMVEEALNFLNAQCRNDEWGYKALLAEDFYMKWFKNQWQERDTLFIAKYELDNHPVEELARHYYGYRRLYNAIHRDALRGDAMNNGYCYIVADVIKKERKVKQVPQHG